MSTLYLLHKPYRVLSRFTDDRARATLADWIGIPDIYPAGRLDYDSEGLLLLTDDGQLAHRLTHPSQKQPKTYRIQVEGIPSDQALEKLRRGVTLNDGPTQPTRVRRIEWNDVPPRKPPVRYRASVPTAWLEITLTEGRNRQVRRMSAHVGHPTLRLIRMSVGHWQLDGLAPGEWCRDTIHLPRASSSCRPRSSPSRIRRRR